MAFYNDIFGSHNRKEQAKEMTDDKDTFYCSACRQTFHGRESYLEHRHSMADSLYDPDRPIQMTPAIVLPEPKPFYGIEPVFWEQMNEKQRQEANDTYSVSVSALQSIYAQLLAPTVVMRGSP